LIQKKFTEKKTVLMVPRQLFFVSDWVDVVWDTGEGQMYRMGADGKYDLSILSGRSFSSASHLAPHFSRSVSSPAAVLASGVVISGANKISATTKSESAVVYTSSISRNTRPVPNRVSSSTLSLPETSGRRVDLTSGTDSASVLTDQTVSAEQLDRPADVRFIFENCGIHADVTFF
jgi:Mib_herc2